MIIALLIELLEKKSSEKYGVQKFNEIVKENGFENYFDLKNHWLDDHKKKIYYQYRNNPRQLEREQKIKKIAFNILKSNTLSKLIYEIKKYPLKLD